MQQRYLQGSSSSPEEMNPPEQHHIKRSPATRRSSMADLDGLPVYDPDSSIVKREIWRLRMARKWVHAIPVVVLLCLFTLWWFGYHPVTVEIKDGKFIAIHPINHSNPSSSSSSSSSHPNNTHRLEIAVLAVATATPPDIDAVPKNFTGENATEEKLPYRVSRID